YSALRECLRRGQLNFQPAPEFTLIAPDTAHLFTRISSNQSALPGQTPSNTDAANRTKIGGGNSLYDHARSYHPMSSVVSLRAGNLTLTQSGTYSKSQCDFKVQI